MEVFTLWVSMMDAGELVFRPLRVYRRLLAAGVLIVTLTACGINFPSSPSDSGAESPPASEQIADDDIVGNWVNPTAGTIVFDADTHFHASGLPVSIFTALESRDHRLESGSGKWQLLYTLSDAGDRHYTVTLGFSVLTALSGGYDLTCEVQRAAAGEHVLVFYTNDPDLNQGYTFRRQTAHDASPSLHA